MNKADLRSPDPEHLIRFEQEKLPYVKLVATTGEGVDEFRAKLWEIAPAESAEPPVLLRDLVGPDETAVLVMPIDKEAPKGRIKQLQAQSIRDLLDGEACCVVVKDAGLQKALDNLKTPPSIVVTDAAGLRAGGAHYSGFHSAHRVFDSLVAVERRSGCADQGRRCRGFAAPWRQGAGR